MPFTQKWPPLRGGKGKKCERTSKEAAPNDWTSGCMASQGDGPDLGRQKIKEMLFLALKTRIFFWPAGAGQRGPEKAFFTLVHGFATLFRILTSYGGQQKFQASSGQGGGGASPAAVEPPEALRSSAGARRECAHDVVRCRLLASKKLTCNGVGSRLV